MQARRVDISGFRVFGLGFSVYAGFGFRDVGLEVSELGGFMLGALLGGKSRGVGREYRCYLKVRGGT